MPERWVPVVGYAKYEVSDLGRVRSSHRKVPFIRKPYVDRHGYHCYGLWSGGQEQGFRVHVLVAAAFIGPRPDGMDIRHLDGNPGNNCVGNLAYGTRSENLLDAVAHGRNRGAAQTHCKHGHEFTPENTIPVGPDRRRRDCRACSDVRRQRHYARVRAERPAAVPQVACRKAGHDWTDPLNVYVRLNGRRWCAACYRETRRADKVACDHCSAVISGGNLLRHMRARHGVDLRAARAGRAS